MIHIEDSRSPGLARLGRVRVKCLGEEPKMPTYQIFIIRALLSVIFALLISRFFFQNTTTIKVAGLASVMLGLAYVLEYFRKREK